MKKNQGITMVSLVITILILMILSSVSIQVSKENYKEMKVQNFLAKMKLIQSQVDNFIEENNAYTMSGSNAPAEMTVIQDGTSVIDTVKLNIDTNKSWDSNLDSNPDNYYYFTSKDLENILGLRDMDISVIINFKTRNVIAVKGVKVGNVTYHRQYDMDGGEQIIE